MIWVRVRVRVGVRVSCRVEINFINFTFKSYPIWVRVRFRVLPDLG